MNLDIYREPSTDQGTFGRAELNGGKDGEWMSVELPWRNNAPQKSCIPAGSYEAEIMDSPKHGRVYMLKNVPGRADVEIHSANWAGNVDLGWHSDLLGCIALGVTKGTLTPKDTGRPQAAILSSSVAMNELMSATGGQPITVIIHDHVDTDLTR